MSCSLRLDNVTLDYFVYSVRAQSLRNAVFNLAVGGKLYKDQGDVTVVGAVEDDTVDLVEGDPQALQNIRKLGQMRLIPSKLIDERIGPIVEFSGLGDFVRLPVKTFSAGMMARLMFACATEFDADILIMDEWLSAGDQDFIEKATARMRAFVEKAKIVVIGTHSMGLVQDVCNKVLVLDAGRVAFYGPTEEWVALGRSMHVRQSA